MRFHTSNMTTSNLLLRALTSLSTAPLAVLDSPMVMLTLILMLIADADDDVDADADAVAGFLKGSSQTFR